MFFPEYSDVRNDVELSRIAGEGAAYACMGCTGPISEGDSIIDMRAGWICHNDVICYGFMKRFGEEHGDRLMEKREENLGHEV